MNCIGCGAIVADIDIPTHPYIGASPGCWKIYTDVCGREYGEFGYPEVHRLTVDAYSVQHPVPPDGKPTQQSIQSVATHLVGLCLTVEHRMTAGQATQGLRAVLKNQEAFTWLDPPDLRNRLTILDVVGAANLNQHEERVTRWARDVWSAWSEHHNTVRNWASGAFRR